MTVHVGHQVIAMLNCSFNPQWGGGNDLPSGRESPFGQLVVKTKMSFYKAMGKKHIETRLLIYSESKVKKYPWSVQSAPTSIVKGD